MLKNITDSFSHIVQKITKKGRLTETQVEEGIRDIRLALIEAEVNLKVIKKFIANLKEKAVEHEIIKNVKASDMLVKIVHDLLVDTLGGSKQSDLLLSEPTKISKVLFSGLQGSGKTTSLAKIAKLYKDKRDILTVSLDMNRPAANEQLKILSEKIGVSFYDRGDEKKPEVVIKKVIKYAAKNVHNLIFFDTAGRTQIDDDSLKELKKINDLIQPQENLFVVDSMMGQQAVQVASRFKESVALTGLVFTKYDSDNRGGAILSVKEIVGSPIKFVGIGENVDDLDEYDPNRIADRILGMGDVVGLVEKAQKVLDEEETAKLSEKLKKNQFDLSDYLKQLNQIKKMGSMSSLVSMMPGLGNKINPDDIDTGELKNIESVILSMTIFERENYTFLMNSNSRKLRVAQGSGTNLLVVNKVLKKFFEMKKMMKNFSNSSKMKKLMGKVGMNEDDFRKIAEKMSKR